MTFDFSKIFDLSKTFAGPDFLLKSKNYCIAMNYVNNSQTERFGVCNVSIWAFYIKFWRENQLNHKLTIVKCW